MSLLVHTIFSAGDLPLGSAFPFFFLFAKAFFFSVHRNFAVCVVRLSERVYEADEIEEN